jgi:hypothetical protein
LASIAGVQIIAELAQHPCRDREQARPATAGVAVRIASCASCSGPRPGSGVGDGAGRGQHGLQGVLAGLLEARQLWDAPDQLEGLVDHAAVDGRTVAAGQGLDAQVLDVVGVGLELLLVQPEVPGVVEPVEQQLALAPGVPIQLGGVDDRMGDVGPEGVDRPVDPVRS